MDESMVTKLSWWGTLLRGIVAIAFGIILLAWPGSTTFVLLVIFGAFALIDGLIEIVQAIVSATRKEKWGAHLIRGLISLIIGVIVFARPGAALVVLLYVIAIWLIASGFVEIVIAIESPAAKSSKWILGIAGAISIIIGILLISFPEAGIWTIILLVGIYALFLGALLIILGITLRSWQKEAAEA